MDQRNEKWKFTEIIVYYSDEYATDITDILNKTILQRVASLNQSVNFRLMWNHDILDFQWIFALQVRNLWRNSPFAGPYMKACKMLGKKSDRTS